MINLTSLLFSLVALVGSSGNHPPDACRKVIVEKVGDARVKTACCAVGQDPGCRIIIKRAGDCDVNTVGGSLALALVSADDGKKMILHPVEQAPKTWIGVRVAPVPEPLAAHLKRAGLMIANVAKDSPADRAGLQRYDVIVSFAGQPIEEMDDLLEAVADTGADNTVELVVIRHGKKRSLTITPVKRRGTGVPAFKYDEPEAPVDLLKDYFGHRFRLGPRGRAFVWPQGRMELPDDVKEWLEDIPDIDWDEWISGFPKMKCLPFGMRIDIDPDDAGCWSWSFDQDEEADVKAEVRIRIEEDGETITIERAADGSIAVERKDADGNRSSATYENVDQLREQDPQAYKTYRRFLAFRSPRMLFISPDLKNLGARQREFEIELKRQFKKARKQAPGPVELYRKFQKEQEIIERKMKAYRRRHLATPTETVVILIDDDGRVTLEIEEDGVSRKYEFNSREDFQDAEPELYERFEKHLDAAR